VTKPKEAGMQDQSQRGHGWTLVLRRQPVRIVEGQPEGGYTDAYELICCECGDDPDQDYRQVSPQLQQIRGPYLFAMGITAYATHARQHGQQVITSQVGRARRHDRLARPAVTSLHDPSQAGRG
jgi:hypothetical protein